MRIVYLDNLKALAIIGVVWLHSFDPIGFNQLTINQAEYPYFLTLATLFRFTVPLFVMISGALLLTKNTDPLHFIKVRIKRLLIPLLGWGSLFALLSYLTTSKFSWNQYLVKFAIFGEPFFLIWVLLFLSLITPLMQIGFKHLSKTYLWIIAISLTIASSLTSLFEQWFIAGHSLLPHFSFSYFFYFMGIYLIGGLLSEIKLPDIRRLTYVSYLITNILMLFLTLKLTQHYGHIPLAEVFSYYLNPIAIVQVISVFIMVKSVSRLTQHFSQISRHISLASLFIYYCHMLIIDLIIHNKLFNQLNHFAYSMVIFTLAFGGSFVIWLIGQKINSNYAKA